MYFILWMQSEENVLQANYWSNHCPIPISNKKPVRNLCNFLESIVHSCLQRVKTQIIIINSIMITPIHDVLFFFFLGFQEISFLEFNAFSCKFVKEKKCVRISPVSISLVFRRKGTPIELPYLAREDDRPIAESSAQSPHTQACTRQL